MLIQKSILFFWFAATIAQLVLSYSCHHNQAHKRRPAFCAFVYFQSIISIVAALTYGLPSMPQMAYFWVYYGSACITAALVLIVALESGKHTLGTRITLPAWAPTRIATMIGTAIALAVALDLIFAATNGGRLTRAMVTTEQGLTLIGLFAFLVIVSYSRKLGIAGNERTHKIITGFVLYLSAFVITIFIRGSSRPMASEIAKLSGMIAYCSSLTWWTVSLWSQEKIPQRPIMKEMCSLAGEMSRIRETATGPA